MNPIIAEISAYDPPILIAAILGCLMFLIVGGNAVIDFWRNIKDKPTGQEVMDKARKEFQPKGDYITREEWNAREKTLSQNLKTLSDENRAILDAGETRETHIVARIDDVQKVIGKLPGEFMALMANAMNVARAQHKKE